MEKTLQIIGGLKKAYPKGFNRTNDPFRVLISTVLSQRNRDESTYPAAKRLFKKFNDVKKLANAKTKDIEKIIKNIGLYRTKARRIKKVSQILLKKYKGKVPNDLEKLLELPGVGRKTANCVLVYAFKKPAIPVDTHVHRISNRIGLVKAKTPEKTEVKLEKVVPQKYWILLNELLVQHGQNICKPISPKCPHCLIKNYCNYYYTKYRKQKIKK